LDTNQRYRVTSIDILRGLVMIIMAIDHTRDFFHVTAMTANPLNPATTTIPLYFTRWITHFCAPTFVFLSGISAFISAQKKPKAQAGTFLIKRGISLILIEITIVTLGATFNPFFNTIILQVIWAIGISLLLLGLLLRFGATAILIIGLLIVVGHNLLDNVNPPGGMAGVAWRLFINTQGNITPLGNNYHLFILYAALPWAGILFAGYGIGVLYQQGYDQIQRKKILLMTGVTLTLLFLLLRYFNVYGNPTPYVETDNTLTNVFNFLNTSKYPPSLQFTCMTLGPACLALSFMENAQNRFTKILTVYGRTPFFYYLIHWYILHTILVISFFIFRSSPEHASATIVNNPSPFYFRPFEFGYGLRYVYLIWFLVVASLYYPCRWYYRYKMTHDHWWLKYV
jgi:uncharacterized membrane protein